MSAALPELPVANPTSYQVGVSCFLQVESSRISAVPANQPNPGHPILDQPAPFESGIQDPFDQLRVRQSHAISQKDDVA